MARALVALGANVGDRQTLLAEAMALVEGERRIRVARISRAYESPAVGGPAGQPTFLNAVALLETDLDPRRLLDVLLDVERRLGRRRQRRWEPRPIDLDLLLYDDCRLDTPDLRLPHPRLAFRRFVLQPAAEVAGEMIDPETRWSVARLLANAEAAGRFVALAGGEPGERRRLALETAARTGAPRITAAAGARAVEPSSDAGRRLAGAIELLRGSADQLRSALHACSSTEVGVCDFWIGELRSQARLALEGQADAGAVYERHWSEVRRAVAQPTLLVVLAAGPAAEAQPARRLEAEFASLVDQVQRWHAGPRLWLAPPASSWLDELIAAVQALRVPVMPA